MRVHLAGPGDEPLLDRVADGVFDDPPRPARTREFLGDPRHHLALALDQDVVVGMASAVHYVHPDKAPELWVNEVGVASTHRRRGVGRRLLEALFDRARELGCAQAWVLTEGDNVAARRLYASVGGTEEERPVYVTFSLETGSTRP